MIYGQSRIQPTQTPSSSISMSRQEYMYIKEILQGFAVYLSLERQWPCAFRDAKSQIAVEYVKTPSPNPDFLMHKCRKISQFKRGRVYLRSLVRRLRFFESVESLLL